MPEVYLKIEWPGNKPDQVYSPSTIINQYFKTGDITSITEFEIRLTEALHIASRRVYEKFGYECTSAMAELARISRVINEMEDKSATVKIL